MPGAAWTCRSGQGWIHQRKGADLAGKMQEEARGAAHPEGSLLWRADFVGNRLALHDSSLRHDLAQVHLSEWHALVSVSP